MACKLVSLGEIEKMLTDFVTSGDPPMQVPTVVNFFAALAKQLTANPAEAAAAAAAAARFNR